MGFSDGGAWPQALRQGFPVLRLSDVANIVPSASVSAFGAKPVTAPPQTARRHAACLRQRMDTTELLRLLNALTSLCFDGETAFRYGLRRARSPVLHEMFLRRAGDCRAAACSLQRLVIQEGGLPAQGGTAAGDICLSLVVVRCALSTDADRVLVDACEQGDALALRW
jgi:uncharacterized protein (TIGR02284 family)